MPHHLPRNNGRQYAKYNVLHDTSHLISLVSIELKSLPEKFLDFLQHFHKPVHLGLGVVEIKTRAGGRFHFSSKQVFKSGGAKMPVVGERFGNAQPPHHRK
jgi:hypothetical protein